MQDVGQARRWRAALTQPPHLPLTLGGSQKILCEKLLVA